MSSWWIAETIDSAVNKLLTPTHRQSRRRRTYAARRSARTADYLAAAGICTGGHSDARARSWREHRDLHGGVAADAEAAALSPCRPPGRSLGNVRQDEPREHQPGRAGLLSPVAARRGRL